MSRLARSGCDVEVVVCTDGEATIGSGLGPEETGRRRRAEAKAACAQLGVAEPAALGLADGTLLQHVDELAQLLGQQIQWTQPDVLLIPWALEAHPDHRAVVVALAQLAVQPIEVWCYEVHTPLYPSHVVPTAPEDLANKRAALNEHRTAALAFNLDTTLALGRWRSLVTTAGKGHAEAFQVVDFDDLSTLAAHVAVAWA